VLKDTPGKTIEKRRRLAVENLIKNQTSISSISEKTGYSVEYLYKIIKTKKTD